MFERSRSALRTRRLRPRRRRHRANPRRQSSTPKRCRPPMNSCMRWSIRRPIPGPPLPQPIVFPRAAFIERLAAFTLDAILIVIAVQGARLRSGVRPRRFLLALAYHVGFWTLKARRSAASSASSVWCASTADGWIPRRARARADRDFFAGGARPRLPLDPEGSGSQAWHDRVAGTFVVKVPRNWPSCRSPDRDWTDARSLALYSPVCAAQSAESAVASVAFTSAGDSRYRNAATHVRSRLPAWPFDGDDKPVQDGFRTRLRDPRSDAASRSSRAFHSPHRRSDRSAGAHRTGAPGRGARADTFSPSCIQTIVKEKNRGPTSSWRTARSARTAST